MSKERVTVPLALRHPQNAPVDLGDVATIAWELTPAGMIRWTIDTSVPVRLEYATIQPNGDGSPIVVELPQGHRIMVGPAKAWVTRDQHTDHDQHLQLVIDSPPTMRADSRRNQQKPEPVASRPKGQFLQEFFLAAVERRGGSKQPTVHAVIAEGQATPVEIKHEGARYIAREGARTPLLEITASQSGTNGAAKVAANGRGKP